MHIPLAAPVVAELPNLLREAAAHSQLLPGDRKVVGKIRHRERTVSGAVKVTATGKAQYPIRVKVQPWLVGPLFIASYRLEADQAISLADLMDIGRDRLELAASKGAAESVLSAYPR